MKNILLLASTLAVVFTIKAPPYAGCLGDLPDKTSPFYDHSKVILPFKSEEHISFSQKYQHVLKDRLETFINMTVENAGPGNELSFYNFPANWIYYGSAGRALTFWKLFLNYEDSDEMLALKYLGLAKEYIDGSLANIRTDQDDKVGFLEGNVGVYAVASVIYDSIGWTE